MTFGDLEGNEKGTVVTDLEVMCWHWRARTGKVKRNVSKDKLSLAETRMEECPRFSLIHKTESYTKTCSGEMGFSFT